MAQNILKMLRKPVKLSWGSRIDSIFYCPKVYSELDKIYLKILNRKWTHEVNNKFHVISKDIIQQPFTRLSYFLLFLSTLENAGTK